MVRCADNIELIAPFLERKIAHIFQLIILFLFTFVGDAADSRNKRIFHKCIPHTSSSIAAEVFRR